MISINNLTLLLDEKMIIDNLSLEISAKVTVIVGKSGVGKSQLLKQILTQNEQIISTSTDYGYMPQDLLLFKWYSIRKNLEIMNKNQRNLDVLLTEFGLENLIDNYPSELSGGQQSRIAFLRAYLMSDEFLLLDEPFSKLDYITHQNMLAWLKNVIASSKHKIILVTHNLDEALFLADEIIILGSHAKIIDKFKQPFNDDLKEVIIEYINNDF